jgi:DNA-binding transcriptional LysR family regulator
MRLRQLEYFVAVAEELSFSQAAATLDISQPVLSRQIAALETELGASLLTRTSRKVALTRSGETFLADARDILNRVEIAIHRVAAGDRPDVRIGTYSTAGLGIIRKIIAEYTATFQDSNVEVSMLPWSEMGPSIREGRVDAGFVTTAAEHRFPDYEGLMMTKLLVDPRVAVVRRDHSLAGRNEVSIDDLSPYSLVQTTALSVTQQDWWNVIPRPDGSSPKSTRSATSVAELLEIVSLTGDVAIATESTAEIRSRTDIEFIPFVDLEPAAVFVAWSAAGANPSIRRFVSIAKQVAKSRQ